MYVFYNLCKNNILFLKFTDLTYSKLHDLLVNIHNFNLHNEHQNIIYKLSSVFLSNESNILCILKCTVLIFLLNISWNHKLIHNQLYIFLCALFSY
jgi:hypothetical protein